MQISKTHKRETNNIQHYNIYGWFEGTYTELEGGISTDIRRFRRLKMVEGFKEYA